MSVYDPFTEDMQAAWIILARTDLRRLVDFPDSLIEFREPDGDDIGCSMFPPIMPSWIDHVSDENYSRKVDRMEEDDG